MVKKDQVLLVSSNWQPTLVSNNKLKGRVEIGLAFASPNSVFSLFTLSFRAPSLRFSSSFVSSCFLTARRFDWVSMAMFLSHLSLFINTAESLDIEYRMRAWFFTFQTTFCVELQSWCVLQYGDYFLMIVFKSGRTGSFLSPSPYLAGPRFLANREAD